MRRPVHGDVPPVAREEVLAVVLREGGVGPHDGVHVLPMRENGLARDATQKRRHGDSQLGKLLGRRRVEGGPPNVVDSRAAKQPMLHGVRLLTHGAGGVNLPRVPLLQQLTREGGAGDNAQKIASFTVKSFRMFRIGAFLIGKSPRISIPPKQSLRKKFTW